ncbi:MAG: THUMP domain-containing protein [Candidatus Nanoarchaeia archaeon]|nr:THUMP domain-containing protein [Candidatus Nanoarchaeia archaeon]
MEYIAYTVIGIEDVAIKEIEELTKAKAKLILPGRLLFSTDEKKINELIYVTKSLTKICLFLSRFTFKSIDDIENELKKIKFPIKGTFAARCTRKGDHAFDSHEIEVLIGNTAPKHYKVNLEKPDTLICANIEDNNCIISIELTRKELQKRDYRIKAHVQSVNPCVAYAMIRLANWKKEETLLDPFCKDGIIAIEAALYASNIPRGFFSNDGKIESIDKKIKRDELKVFAYDALMPNVRSTEINAKLASVNKQITFSRTELDWLETKFKKDSVDKIVTAVPSVKDEKEMGKTYKEFFYQAEYIMKKKGIIVAAIHHPEIFKEFAKGFKLLKERKITIGEYSYCVLSFEKK